MLFGLTKTLVVFQALVNYVLQDFSNRCACVYLEDILIFSCHPQEHTNHVCQILQHLLENKLYVNAEKFASCPFSHHPRLCH